MVEIIIIITIVLIVILAVKKAVKKSNSVDSYTTNDQTRDIPAQPELPSKQPSGNTFTLAELKAADPEKYYWDESGNVSVVNPDGSVSIVGRFNPEELVSDPADELYDQLVSDGLLDMLPRMWGFLEKKTDIELEWRYRFILTSQSEILSISYPFDCITQEKVLSITPEKLSVDSDITPGLKALIEKGAGIIILMPVNAREHILSLGAKSCIERVFVNHIKVRITTPSVMGAFGSALLANNTHKYNISFAYGQNDEYSCCNMKVENGVYDVTSILSSSVIQPGDLSMSLEYIAKGTLTYSLVIERELNDILLLDITTYPIAIAVITNQTIIKTIPFFDNIKKIPCREEKTLSISLMQDYRLAFYIGDNELIEDIISECEMETINSGNIKIAIDIDCNQAICIDVSTNTAQRQLNVGQLIG